MNLEEAIKLIQADIDDEDVEWDSPLGRAYKLGIEALKAVRSARATNYWTPIPLLPGETKD